MATRKPPTAAEVRKAFRAGVDAAGLPPEARRLALEAFNESIRMGGPQKKNRRQIQNEALNAVDELMVIVSDPLFEDSVKGIILRNDFTSGQLFRDHESIEDIMAIGLSALPPTQGDPTGEVAIWAEMGDRTGDTILDICESMARNLVSVKQLLNLSSIDVREREERTIPRCHACGDEILNQNEMRDGGFDIKCAVRRKRYKNARDYRGDRGVFIAFVRAERVAKAETDDLVETDVV